MEKKSEVRYVIFVSRFKGKRFIIIIVVNTSSGFYRIFSYFFISIIPRTYIVKCECKIYFSICTT
nr:MAG TPA: hypothetical protein [Bacteriophage sp.]